MFFFRNHLDCNDEPNLTIQEEDNIECLQHLLLQLRDCEEDDIRGELKLLAHNLCIEL